MIEKFWTKEGRCGSQGDGKSLLPVYEIRDILDYPCLMSKQAKELGA